MSSIVGVIVALFLSTYTLLILGPKLSFDALIVVSGIITLTPVCVFSNAF